MPADTPWYQGKGAIFIGLGLIAVAVSIPLSLHRGSLALANASEDRSKGQQRATSLSDAVHEPPSPTSPADSAAQIHLAATEGNIKAAMDRIRERIEQGRVSTKSKALAGTEIVTAIDAILPLAESAQTDLDAICRHTDEIAFELEFAERMYAFLSGYFRARAKRHPEPFQSTTLRIAEEYAALAADVPRKQSITATFRSELSQIRTRIVVSARVLQELKASTSASSVGSRRPNYSAEAQLFQAKTEEFFELVDTFQRDFNAPSSTVVNKRP